MRAMTWVRPGAPLALVERPPPEPRPQEVLLRVRACGVCRTDLHVVDGELPDPKPSVVPGHEIVGTVERLGAEVKDVAVGERIGVPWLGSTCGECAFCRGGRENLCAQARFTGYQLDGGFADRAVADARYCFPLRSGMDDVHAAPLLCAGLIGFRAYRFAGDARRIGIYGFGAAAHIVAQVARAEGREVFAFTRRGDVAAQALAKELGAAWAGASDEPPPVPLDAAILFAPEGGLVPLALRAVDRGGTVVCAGIHMSEIPSFPYSLLWGERTIRSVANLTREDGRRFLELAPRVPVRTRVTPFPLPAANEALSALRSGQLVGAAVLVP